MTKEVEVEERHIQRMLNAAEEAKKPGSKREVFELCQSEPYEAPWQIGIFDTKSAAEKTMFEYIAHPNNFEESFFIKRWIVNEPFSFYTDEVDTWSYHFPEQLVKYQEYVEDTVLYSEEELLASESRHTDGA